MVKHQTENPSTILTWVQLPSTASFCSSQKQCSVQTLILVLVLQCSHNPYAQRYASTSSVHTLKIPDTGSVEAIPLFCWTHKNAAHTRLVGMSIWVVLFLGMLKPYPDKVTQIYLSDLLTPTQSQIKIEIYKIQHFPSVPLAGFANYFPLHLAVY